MTDETGQKAHDGLSCTCRYLCAYAEKAIDDHVLLLAEIDELETRVKELEVLVKDQSVLLKKLYARITPCR